MKTRTFPEYNYRGIYHDGKTMRIALDPKKPIGELAFPEFLDVKITSHCDGACPYCYQSSKSTDGHHTGLVERFESFFSGMSDNEKPFQIAFGGGEPTSHPEFADLMRSCCKLGITPNYTTNGMWSHTGQAGEVLDATVKYCGGVAVSTHPHLEEHWRGAVDMLLNAGVHTNLHVIIGDRDSIGKFKAIYDEYHGRIRYFVLLPMSAQGRSTESFSDWQYLKDAIDGSPKDIAFGANFHPYLSKEPGRFRVSIYEPECMSAYLDLETMKAFRSSFSNEERFIQLTKRAA
jgi:hypothetical protein